MFVWSPSVAFLCFFSMLLFPFIPCHPIDTESILLKASIPSKILFSFRGLNVCNSVCAWMGLWMWKCQCHSRLHLLSLAPLTHQYHMLNYVTMYFIFGEKVQWKLFFIIMFALHETVMHRRSDGVEAHENRALKYIEISRTICRFVSIDRINSKLAKQKWSV